jgi:hypothetical protein
MAKPAIDATDRHVDLTWNENDIAVERVDYRYLRSRKHRVEMHGVSIDSTQAGVCHLIRYWVSDRPDGNRRSRGAGCLKKTLECVGRELDVVVEPEKVIRRSINGFALRNRHCASPVQIPGPLNHAKPRPLCGNGVRSTVGRSIVDQDRVELHSRFNDLIEERMESAHRQSAPVVASKNRCHVNAHGDEGTECGAPIRSGTR